MTVPNATPIYFSDIIGEFGGWVGAPYYLSQYYAGGGRVPAGTAGANGAIPSSGGISLWHFMGASNYIDLQTVGAGQRNYGNGPAYGFCSPSYDIAFGSCSDGTFNPISNTAIMELYHHHRYAGGGWLMFRVLNSPANGYWNRLTMSGPGVQGGAITTYDRGAAAFVGPGDYTAWYWEWGSGTQPSVFTPGQTTYVTTT